jgi:UDP-glucuronate 4-epimerase
MSKSVFNSLQVFRGWRHWLLLSNMQVLDNPAKSNQAWSGKASDPSSSSAPYKIYNIGNNNSVKLMGDIEEIV